MATITKTVGTASRDYSTVTAFIAALPTNLVTDGNIYQAQCYNDSQFTEQVTLSGHTTDATHYVEITTGPGQSFQDNASVRTLALTYNQSNGVGFSRATSQASFKISDNYTRVSKLQIKSTNSYGEVISANSAGTVGTSYKDLLCDCSGSSSGGSTTALIDIGSFNGSGGFIVNVQLFARAAGSNGIKVAGSTTAIGCTAVLASGMSTTKAGFISQYGSNKLQSCASFGFGVAADTTAWDGTNSKNNATDQASGLPGSSNQFSVTYTATSPFTQAGTSGTDMRTVTGTALSSNGFLDATNAPNDISGTARTSSPTIGHWQLVSAGVAPQGFYPYYPNLLNRPHEVVSY